jgi:ribosomal-protein-alanine N-acetyltransferase
LDLALYARRRVLLIEWEELRAVVRATAATNRSDHPGQARNRYDLFYGEREHAGCFWASTVGSVKIAHLVALIVHDDYSQSAVTGAFLPQVKRALCRRGVAQIAYLGVESWLTEMLAESGFAHSGSVVTLQKANGCMPDLDDVDLRDAEVVLEQAQPSDLPALLALDQRAFAPLWHTAPPTMLKELALSPYFVLAKRREQIVGYAYVSLTGRHGHLTRLAIDPSAQGQRIGAHLLAACIRFFQQQGVYGITLNTQQENAPARRLYEWFGFTLLGKEAEVWLCAL